MISYESFTINKPARRKNPLLGFDNQNIDVNRWR